MQIAHNVTVGAHSIIVSQTGISGSTTLGRYVTLAGQVGLAGHLNLGDRATITAQSGINKDVPAGAVLSGHHALPIRESLKLEALTRRLPEIVERLKALEEKIQRFALIVAALVTPTCGLRAAGSFSSLYEPKRLHKRA